MILDIDSYKLYHDCTGLLCCKSLFLDSVVLSDALLQLGLLLPLEGATASVEAH